MEDLIAELGLNLPRLMIRTRPAEGKGKGRIAALIHKFDAAAAIESPADPVMTYSTRRFDSAPPVAVITTAPQVLQVVAPTLTPGKATFDFTSALHDLLQIGRMEVDGAGPEASKNVVDAVEHYAGVIVNDLLKTISDPIARERIAQSVWRRLETLAKANQRHNEIQTVVAQKQQPFVLAGFGSAATKERRDRRNYGKQQGQSGRGGRGGKRAFVNHAQNRSPFPPHKLQGRRHGQGGLSALSFVWHVLRLSVIRKP